MRVVPSPVAAVGVPKRMIDRGTKGVGVRRQAGSACSAYASASGKVVHLAGNEAANRGDQRQVTRLVWPVRLLHPPFNHLDLAEPAREVAGKEQDPTSASPNTGATSYQDSGMASSQSRTNRSSPKFSLSLRYRLNTRPPSSASSPAMAWLEWPGPAVVIQEPATGAAMQLGAPRLALAVELVAQVVGEELVIAKPVAIVVKRKENRHCPLQPLQHILAIGPAGHRIEEGPQRRSRMLVWSRKPRVSSGRPLRTSSLK